MSPTKQKGEKPPPTVIACIAKHGQCGTACPARRLEIIPKLPLDRGWIKWSILVALASSPQFVDSETLATPERCTVAVVYEDGAARDLTIQICEDLAQKFSDDLQFEFSWWRFKYLSDEEIARRAAETTEVADLILVSVNTPEGFSPAVKAWFEEWAARRTADGAIALVRTASRRLIDDGSVEAYVRRIAERAKLDFLAVSAGGSSADSSDRLSEAFLASGQPAFQEGNKPHFHSSGWGINE